jgi:hypothetical protein
MDVNEIRYLFNYLENNQKFLNPLQNDFISSLKRYYKYTGVLTLKQFECLNDIKEYIPATVEAE